ncbi:MerR family transcriptional regulator [Paraliobacillus sediminis]|uniref:MerR family transcriptional regulator n=1 Tax=Paraliobacillus sediminis TaxID=1885916 RepID=UPI000E3E61A4|nr:MerR family transcriptional regulator [Paraliobacillus sediminis]
MEINPKIHLSTGQFANLMDVSKDTLFHYDKVGIFSPEIKVGNGYRYYSIYQSDVFYVITTLKELDMPLKEIKAYLHKRSPEELILLLEKEAVNLTAKINHLQKLSDFILEKSRITKEAIGINTSDIIFEERDEERLLVTEANDSIEDKNIYDSIFYHDNCLKNYNIDTTHSPGWMIDKKKVSTHENMKYDYLFTRVNKSNYFNFTIKKGTFLVAYHAQGYADIDQTYSKILDYAKTNALDIQGFFYEDVLLDELSVKGFEKYLTKISVQIIT